jgi:predicted transcriptional regulator
VNSLSSIVNSLEWRRSKVLELSSQGHSQPEIARILQISQPTVNRDIGFLRGQARENLQKHIQDKLPEEYQNCMTGINQVLKICWNKSRMSIMIMVIQLQLLKLSLIILSPTQFIQRFIE